MGERNIMKHLKEEKEKKSLTRGTKIAICVAAGLLTAIGVCVGLWLTNRVTGYSEAKDYTATILEAKAAVEDFLNSEIGEEGLTEESQAMFAKISEAVEECAGYMESLGASAVLKNERVNEKYEVAKTKMAQLQLAKERSAIVMEVLADGEISDDELEMLKKLGVEKMAEMAEDLTEYRSKVTEFQTKYKEASGVDKTTLDNDYTNLVAAGEELTEKYAELELSDVLGMSRDDILGFYGTIEELDETLSNYL